MLVVNKAFTFLAALAMSVRAEISVVYDSQVCQETSTRKIYRREPDPEVPPNSYCPCGDKSNSIEGQGKVTGGGWIYLTKDSYFNSDLICGKGTRHALCQSYHNTERLDALVGIKANYGFNAMWRKGVPHGSTNFDFEGAGFHFHSDTRNTPYRFLEVVDEVHARWMGTGVLATKMNPLKNDWVDGFCFMVSVQDHGEPGSEDTWRLRIWDCKLCPQYPGSSLSTNVTEFMACGDIEDILVFDTNYVKPSIDSTYVLDYPLPSTTEEDDPDRYRFNGTNVGDLIENGGGNIQIHLNGKPNKLLEYMEQEGIACGCANVPFEGDGHGFVTGGGFVNLDEQAFLRTAACSETDKETSFITCATPNITGIKANFGFNAKYIKGLAEGHTNFDIDGNFFHFQSDTSADGSEYDGLEVVCADVPYGKGGKNRWARWTGLGKVSRDGGGSWTPGFRYYIAVTDNGEPGITDMWHIRIMNGDTTTLVLFDTDINAGPIYDTELECLTLAGCSESDTTFPDFEGEFLGGFANFTSKGGGNIMVHCKGGPSRRRF